MAPPAVHLADPAAGAPVAAADAVVVLPAAPVLPDGPHAPVSAQQRWVSVFWVFVSFLLGCGTALNFRKKHIAIFLFLLTKHLLVISAVML